MDDSNDKLIRDYALGALSGKDLEIFEQRLQRDPALASELDIYLALKALDNHRLKKLFKKEKIDHQLTPEKPQQAKYIKILGWLATSIIALILLFVGWKALQKPPIQDVKQMAQSFIGTPYPPPVATMGGNDTLPLSIQQAFMAYRNQSFSSAAQQFLSIGTDQTVTDEMLFYTGESLLQIGQWQNAITYFERIPPGYWREIADWRSALALIQLGDNNKARLLLEGLRQTSRREQAERLLHEMPN